MGYVYKARQRAAPRPLRGGKKVMTRTMAVNAEFAQRFMQEAKALAALSHPNIVSVHDFGREGDQYFIVMEFVDGTNLRPLLAAQKISPKEALKIIPVLCDALEFAHSQGVVHRDIKPENILLDKAGRVKIADFGLAKMAGPAGSANMTRTSVAMGTPQYMAPEQFENAKAVDHRADIYSMGVLFYEMLTGELPMGRFQAPSARKIELDVRLDEIVLRALEKEPGRRYQSMGDVSRDVTRVSGIAPSERRPARSAAMLPWILTGVAACVIFVLLLLRGPGENSQTPGGPATTETARATAPLPAASTDPWTGATIAANELPPNWHIVSSEDAAERAEVLELARAWGMAGTGQDHRTRPQDRTGRPAETHDAYLRIQSAPIRTASMAASIIL